MSLCIAVNNPGNFVIISSDGRTMRGNEIVTNSHKKLTNLTDHVLMFCSGAQDSCEELRKEVSKQVNEYTTIEEIAGIVQRESLEIHSRFIQDHPTYYELNLNAACLATVLAFYDVEKKECGIIEYCHKSDFKPHIYDDSIMVARGLSRDFALDYLPNHFDPNNPIECVLNTFKMINLQEPRVGGAISINVISQNGTAYHEMGELL